MISGNIQVCAVLRNFESDVEYLSFPNADYKPYDNFWIQKMSQDDRNPLLKELKYYSPVFDHNHLLCKWHYVGRGKNVSILRDNSTVFYFPLFRLLKLFKNGNLIIPSIFTKYKERSHKIPFHGGQ